MNRRRIAPRELLVASVGVATLNYLGAAPTDGQMTRRRPNPRKLLVASVGVATLNYLPTACSTDTMSSVANLLAPPLDGGPRNIGKDSATDAAPDARGEGGVPPSPTVANLVAPAPKSFRKGDKESG